MAGDKTLENSQFARAAADGGDAAPASQTAKANNQGTEPLADEFGRLWVHVVGGNNGPFMTRVQVPTAITAQQLFRQFLASAGIVTALQVHLQGIEVQTFGGASPTDGVFVQVHDSVGAPAALAIPLASFPLQANKLILSADSGIEVALGAVVVLSSTVAVYTAVAASQSGGDFISQGVGFV